MNSDSWMALRSSEMLPSMTRAFDRYGAGE
jgi:hypothetical protein